MTQPTNWYEQMAKAIREREKCLAAIDRWTVQLVQAEAAMADLAASAPETPPVVTGTASADISGLAVAAEDLDPAQV